MIKKLLFASVVLFLALTSLAPAQSFVRLVNQPPGGAYLSFLLTDGAVMSQANDYSHWWKLTPDINGSYVNGTWTRLAPLESGYAPNDFASAVLADGRVIILGGEYNNGSFVLSNLGEIYDPVANTWTPLDPPSGWDFIGDSPSVVLPDGRFLVGNKLNMEMAALDPGTLTWTMLGSTGKSDFHAEEGWTLLPDGTVLTCDVQNAPHSERYFPSTQSWPRVGNTIVDLHSPSPFKGCSQYGDLGQFCYYPPGEIGPAILRPDGTVFATGSFSKVKAGHTAIYTPSRDMTGAGTWAAGPDFPNNDDAGDSFAVLLPNGNVLLEGNSGQMYEFDGVTFNPTLETFGYLIVLPTGEVLSADGRAVKLYTPANTSYAPAWAPQIKGYPKTVQRGNTYAISGQQFNGLSQAAASGDELETATNYPLVRLTNTKTHHVFYGRTHDHSTMGVATGTQLVSTNFDVPATMETGTCTLEVVANGIPSPAVTVTVL